MALVVAALVLSALIAAAGQARADDPPAPVPITEGTLTWGIKTSWVQYVGPGETSGGVTATSELVGGFLDTTYEFPIGGGSYDPVTRTTTIEAEGTIHWQKYKEAGFSPPAGYTGPLDIHILDVRFTDPRLTISAEGSTITVEAVSRDRGTWELVDYGRIPIAELDAAVVTPSVDGGTTTWEGIPAALTEDGAENAFGGGYSVGQFVDPLSFSYVGEGGAPDFGEHWTAPDTTGISLVRNTIFGTTGTLPITFAQPEAGLVHHSTALNGERRLRAFDPETGETLGESPYITKWGSSPIVDPVSGTLYSRSSSGGPVDSWLRWDSGTETYQEGPIPGGGFTMRGSASLWDEEGQRALTINREAPAGIGSTDYENHVWYLNAYVRQPDGSFLEKRYRLPNAPSGWNRNWYGGASSAAVLPDGSILIPSGSLNLPAADAVPLQTVPAKRFFLDDEAGTVSVEDVSGTELSFDEHDTRPWERAFASVNGNLSLVRKGNFAGPTRVLQLHLTEGGDPEQVGDLVEITIAKLSAIAFDPTDGTFWNLDNEPKKLTAVRGGRVTATHTLPLVHTKSVGVGVVPGEGVYLISSDGNPLGLGETLHGLAYYKLDGYSPTVTGQPADESIDVEIGGNGPVEFTAAATGTPAPTVQWQRRAPGSSRFADLNGETAATLEVDASAADNGAAYRAVFSNPAGSLASEPAELEVRYAPSVAFDPVDLAVVEGDDAVFSVLTSASPDPSFTWQRRVNGFWQPVDLDSGDFETDGNTLTVNETNTDMDGARFRAKVSNPIGVVFTKAAELTVAPAVTGPVTFGSGYVDWGFANRWRCYVVGNVAQGGIEVLGGVTRNAGTLATGSLCTGRNAGSETLRFPVRGGSFDPTTGALEVKLNGKVRFWGHAHHAAGNNTPLLDTTFSNLRIVAAGATGTLYADAVGATMEDPVPVSRTAVPLVELDFGGAEPTPTGDGLTWNSVPSSLTSNGVEVFDSYPAGEPFDPISLSLVYGTPEEDPPADEVSPPNPPTPASTGSPVPQTLVAPRAKKRVVKPRQKRTRPCKRGKRRVKVKGKARCVRAKHAVKAGKGG